MVDPDDEYLTLEQAAALIPGADAMTLKRRARQGKLVVYRPGKAFVTTRRHVRDMVEATAIKPTEARPVDPTKQRQLHLKAAASIGMSEMDLSRAALDLVLDDIHQKHKAKREAEKAARKAENDRIKIERAIKKGKKR